MEGDVSVAVSKQSEVMWYFDSAEDEFTAFNEAMDIVAVSYSEHMQGISYKKIWTEGIEGREEKESGAAQGRINGVLP